MFVLHNTSDSISMGTIYTLIIRVSSKLCCYGYHEYIDTQIPDLDQYYCHNSDFQRIVKTCMYNILVYKTCNILD